MQRKYLIYIIFFCLTFIIFQTAHCNINLNISKQHIQLNQPNSIIYKFYLKNDSQTTIRFINIFGGDEILFEENNPRESGWHKVVLHSETLKRGNYRSGVYYLEIEGKDKNNKSIEFNSFQSPWGELVNVSNVEFNKKTGKITYDLPKLSMVRVRIGLKDGALIRTLINWEPRTKGNNNVFWDGYDQTGKVKINEKLETIVQVQGFGLPQTTFYLYNDIKPIDRQLKLSYPENWKKYTVFYLAKNNWNNMYDSSIDFEIETKNDSSFTLIFPESNINDKLNKFFTTDNEIYISLDGEFLCEHYGIKIPDQYTIAVSEFKKGKHVIVINLFLGVDNVAIGSKEILIK